MNGIPAIDIRQGPQTLGAFFMPWIGVKASEPTVQSNQVDGIPHFVLTSSI